MIALAYPFPIGADIEFDDPTFGNLSGRICEYHIDLARCCLSAWVHIDHELRDIFYSVPAITLKARSKAAEAQDATVE